jgi:hypothetical protein
MVIDPRTEPPHILEFDVVTTYLSYLATINSAGTMEDFYRFITVPSVRRERFILSLQGVIYKADDRSIIEQLNN